MNEPIDVLITVPLAEALVAKIQTLSPRLNVRQIKVSRPEDISADIWTTIEILYTARVIPTPEMAPNLRWIQFHYAGIDHAREALILARPGLTATTMSGASASQISEYVLMMMLVHGHRLAEMIEQQRKSNWPKDRWERFSPQELRTSTVGIVGYGSVGRQVARLLQGFGARVFATKRDVFHPEDSGYTIDGQGDPQGDYVHRLYPTEALKSMAKESDFLVVSAPLAPRTRGLVNAEVFEVMKPTAVLVDIARGGIVDHTALIQALKEKRIAGASLDVYPEEPLPADSPLWKMPNVFLSPHISGNSLYYDERAVDLFSENLRRYLASEELLNRFQGEWGY